MTSPGNILFSLQTKLIVAFSLVVLVALAVAGTIFVAVRRGDEERQALDRVIAASPAIYTDFTVLQRRGADEDTLAQYVRAAAEQLDVHILLVERSSGTVFEDSSGELQGQTLHFPEEVDVQRQGRLRSYVSWHPEGGSPGSDLVLVSFLPGNIRPLPAEVEPYGLLLATPQATISGAWRGLLPQVGIAAAIALPIAVVLGTLVAGYISRPLRQLTLASQRMAEGVYDVKVSVDRSDEVGRLAQTFSTMSHRVGETHAQMRALVANVSHDLKTPLTSILGFAQALRDGGAKDDADTKRLGAVIYEEATRLNDRLNDLMYLAELESGQLVLQRDVIDVARLVEGVLERVRPAAEARGLDVTAELPDGLTVSGDGSRLERALENLLDNARKYTPTGGEIRVRAYANAGHANIEVVNSAPDITADELPRLFERFYRRDRTRGNESARAGSGLGLAIARELVELHGGTLDAALRDEEIAFIISLPATA